MFKTFKKKKTDLVIVNRSFWPTSQIIGGSLLKLAENVVRNKSVSIVTQSKSNLSNILKQSDRGIGVKTYSLKSITTSNSNLVKRLVESIVFMGWTFISLLHAKPANIYVSTNPPVVVPFIVAIYCRLFGAKYVYHVQDIHPEITNVVVPLNKLVFLILKSIDNYSLRHAKSIITISEDMKSYIQERSNTSSPIYLLDNPSLDVTLIPLTERTKDIVFCGNAGRLQLIPLLVEAIREYLEKGGKLKFTFAGGGVQASRISSLAESYEQVEYLGVISELSAAQLVNQHRWAILPIEDEVTKYAFPSKSSRYALSQVSVLAICGKDTSVSKWVKNLDIGMLCEPNHDEIVKCLFAIEDSKLKDTNLESNKIHDDLKNKLQVSYFVEKLQYILLEK